MQQSSRAFRRFLHPWGMAEATFAKRKREREKGMRTYDVANEVECRGTATPGKGWLIFRVADIGRSIVLVFRPTGQWRSTKDGSCSWWSCRNAGFRRYGRSMVSRSRHCRDSFRFIVIAPRYATRENCIDWIASRNSLFGLWEDRTIALG